MIGLARETAFAICRAFILDLTRLKVMTRLADSFGFSDVNVIRRAAG